MKRGSRLFRSLGECLESIRQSFDAFLTTFETKRCSVEQRQFLNSKVFMLFLKPVGEGCFGESDNYLLIFVLFVFINFYLSEYRILRIQKLVPWILLGALPRSIFQQLVIWSNKSWCSHICARLFKAWLNLF